MLVHQILEIIIPYIAGVLELVGVIIIAIAAIRAVIGLISNRFNFGDSKIGVNFAEALSLSLDFKLGAEIMLTVLVQNMDDLKVIVGVALLRIFITLVLHWELKEAKEDNEEYTKILKEVK